MLRDLGFDAPSRLWSLALLGVVAVLLLAARHDVVVVVTPVDLTVPRRAQGRNAFEPFLFSIMGPLQLGDPSAPAASPPAALVATARPAGARRSTMSSGPPGWTDPRCPEALR